MSCFNYQSDFFPLGDTENILHVGGACITKDCPYQQIGKHPRRPYDTCLLPNAVTHPSNVSLSTLGDRRHYSTFLTRKVFLDVFQIMSTSSDASNFCTKSKSILQSLLYLSRPNKLFSRGGLFAPSNQSGFMRGEIVFTSSLAIDFQRLLSESMGDRVRCYHQMKDCVGGIIDIAVYLTEEEGDDKYLPDAQPVALFECALDASVGSKHAQVAAYAINTFYQLKAPYERVLLTIEFMIESGCGTNAPWLCLRGFCWNGQTKSLDDCLIWQGYLDAEGSTIHNLIKAIKHVADHNCVGEGTSGWTGMRNIGIQGDSLVWKVFDYRQRHVEETQRRHHEHYESLLGATIVHKSKDLVLIQYPFVAGSCFPSTVAQLLSVARQIKHLHAGGIVHGDISGPSTKCYPDGFNLRIPDGARHPEVLDGVRLAKEHDWFSFAAILRLFKCKGKKAEWGEIIRQFEENTPKKAIRALNDLLGLPIKVTKDKQQLLTCETGSPLRGR